MSDFILEAARPIARRGAALPRLVHAMLVRCLRWQRRQRDRAALLSQPDYLLRDIGLQRRDIERAMRGDWMR